MKQDIDIERVVLGSILLESHTAMSVASSILKEDVFFKNEHKLIWTACNNLYKVNRNIDILTVTTELKALGVVNLDGEATSYYVSKLTERIGGTNHLESHCRILYQLYLLRELDKLGLEIQNDANASVADCFEIIGGIEKRLQGLTSIIGNSIKHIKDVHTEIIKEQKEVLSGNVKTGQLSGISNLDMVTGGWQNGNLIIIGARPAMGKSAFALQLAKNPAMTQSTPVAVFSLEMTSNDLVGRLVASETGINNTKIIQKRLNAGELMYIENNCDALINAPIYFDDTSGLSISQLKNKARKLYYEKGVRLFIIDYLQLASGEGNNKEQQVSDISRGLKILAKELNVPVIALCQLNRSVELRPDKRPQLSDLRDSGAIEQDADIVMLLFRPIYYEQTEPYSFGAYVLDPTDLLIIDIVKGRGLKTGEVPVKFYGETMIISNYDL